MPSAAKHPGPQEFDAAVTFDSTADFNGAVTFDAAVDCDGQVDLTGATVESANRTVASDGALAIGGSDRVIILLASASGAKAATITPPTANAAGGPLLTVILKARSGGSYTIACTNASTSGTLTLDAADEGGVFAWVNGTLHLVHVLGTATFA